MEQIGYPWFMNCRCVLREEGLFVCLFRVSKAEECIINKSKEERRRESEKKNRIIVCSEGKKPFHGFHSAWIEFLSSLVQKRGGWFFWRIYWSILFCSVVCVGVCCEFQQ